jgi:hypothetical protein
VVLGTSLCIVDLSVRPLPPTNVPARCSLGIPRSFGAPLGDALHCLVLLHVLVTNRTSRWPRWLLSTSRCGCSSGAPRGGKTHGQVSPQPEAAPNLAANPTARCPTTASDSARGDQARVWDRMAILPVPHAAASPSGITLQLLSL